MRDVTLASLAAALLVLATGAQAGPAPKDDPKQKRICTTETIVGSHLPRRVCSTVAEREALRNEAQEKMANLHRQSRAIGKTGGAQ
jgi:hypothetical protein